MTTEKQSQVSQGEVSQGEVSQSEVIMGPMRPPFLTLVPACVLLGIATASWAGLEWNWLHLALVIVGALASHIGVNTLNEYDDFKTGLDLKTERTPFSGGSGTLPRHPTRARSALVSGIVSVAVVVAVGIYFALVRGWGIVPLGLLGVVVVVTYTKWLTHEPLLCLIAPGLGFGPFMVMGTHFALTGSYSWTAFCASLVPFFLVSNLLLLNQFPDVEADRSIGRRHVLITAGRRVGIVVYGLFLIAAYATVVIGWWAGALPVASLLALATLLLAIPTFRGVAQHADSIPELIPYMGKNVVITLATPVLVAVGLFVG